MNFSIFGMSITVTLSEPVVEMYAALLSGAIAMPKGGV